MDKRNFCKKWIVLGIICIFFGASVIPLTTADSNREFGNLTLNGDTLYVGGSGPGNYSKIKDAVDNASDGDTVFVFDDSSPYIERIQIRKTIQLIGENKETTVIDAGSTSYTNVVEIYHNVSGVTINGFTIKQGMHGIDIYGDGYNIISNNNIIENNFPLIIRKNAVNNLISDNYIDAAGEKVSLTIVSSNNIFKNNIIANDDGIEFLESHNNTIEFNEFKNLTWGIVFHRAYNNKIFNNNFIDCRNCALQYIRYDNGYRFRIRNRWYGNFWNRPRVLPKAIIGIVILLPIIHPLFNFDCHPANEPYQI